MISQRFGVAVVSDLFHLWVLELFYIWVVLHAKVPDLTQWLANPLSSQIWKSGGAIAPPAPLIPPPLPGCHEINSFLRPLVKELNMLWNEGFSMRHDGNSIVIHPALLATVCDVPTTAKLGGFLSHASKHACWKCT